MHILIVDDEPFQREELKEALDRITQGNTYYSADSYESAIIIVQKNSIDIAFLDIQMPGKNGLSLAQSIKKESPNTNIVIVTAYSQYALDALKLFVSGYLLKPVMDDDLKEVLHNLRTPVETVKAPNKAVVNCFGLFDVFVDNKPMKFKRTKEKELLAYLICLKGASASRGEVCNAIFEESTSPDKDFSYLRTVMSALKKDLHKYGIDDILIHNNNSYSVNLDAVDCDYYNYLLGKADGFHQYSGKFMSQYSWAEAYIYELENY